MASNLGKRSSSRAVSTANRDRALERISRELTALIEHSPAMRSAFANDPAAAVELRRNTMAHWHLLRQSIGFLWP